MKSSGTKQPEPTSIWRHSQPCSRKIANAKSNSFIVRAKSCSLFGYIGSRESLASVVAALRVGRSRGGEGFDPPSRAGTGIVREAAEVCNYQMCSRIMENKMLCAVKVN
jgi:hypothetical protein